VIKRAHRAVKRVDGLGQARRAWFGGAAHLQAREKSSVSMISLTDSEAVTGGCGLGVASTCERRAGMWQHSAGRSASRCESVRYCCTCSQAAAVAESEVGAKTSADEVVALARALQMSRFSTAAEHLLGHGGRREL